MRFSFRTEGRGPKTEGSPAGSRSRSRTHTRPRPRSRTRTRHRHRNRIRPGTRVKALTRLVDIGPTLLDLADIPVPRGLDGISLRPELEGRPGPVRAGMTHHKTIRGLVTSDHLFVEDTGATILTWPSHNAKAAVEKVQLYDRRADPLGRANIAAAHPDIVARLRATLSVLEKGRAHTPRMPLSAEVRRLMRQDGYLPE